jgi:hypothetical protein
MEGALASACCALPRRKAEIKNIILNIKFFIIEQTVKNDCSSIQFLTPAASFVYNKKINTIK